MTTTDDLTPREGKVLRYVISTYTLPVVPARLVNSIEWSDLPHDQLQARAALEKLRKLGLVKRQGSGYVATGDGATLIRGANKEGIWQD